MAHTLRAEPLGSDVRMHALGPLRGAVRLPGSKSLTNRLLMCAALADGRSLLHGAAAADDVRRMIAALRRLGVSVAEETAGSRLSIDGCRGQLPATEADLDVGHAGTAMRFLTALCSLGHGAYRIDGSARMRERPIGDLVDALRTLGAAIGYEGREGLPPVLVRGGGLRGGSVSFSNVVSSQFVSALLMAAPYAGGDVLIEIRGKVSSAPYLAMTLDVMRRMGAEALSDSTADGAPADDGARFIVPAPQRYRATSIDVEPDASGASYFWAAAAVSGGRVLVHGLHDTSVQGDVRFVHVLEQMGCRVEREPEGIAVLGPGPGGLRGVDVDLNAMPDVVQTLAAVALFARGPTTIRNVANLRVKETDRLAALERELTRLGAEIALAPDGLTIRPPATPRPAALDTHDDHRMAMSLSVAGLACEGVVIRDAGVVSKSLPEFFSLLNGFGR